MKSPNFKGTVHPESKVQSLPETSSMIMIRDHLNLWCHQLLINQQQKWGCVSLEQLLITSNSSLVKLNSCPSQMKTALPCTCRSLWRMSWYHLRCWQEPGLILDDRLSCTANITAVARSCRFALNSIHRIWSDSSESNCDRAVQRAADVMFTPSSWIKAEDDFRFFLFDACRNKTTHFTQELWFIHHIAEETMSH